MAVLMVHLDYVWRLFNGQFSPPLCCVTQANDIRLDLLYASHLHFSRQYVEMLSSLTVTGKCFAWNDTFTTVHMKSYLRGQNTWAHLDSVKCIWGNSREKIDP